jgi:cobalt-zinc-cadmium efflux system outer membrane protein
MDARSHLPLIIDRYSRSMLLILTLALQLAAAPEPPPPQPALPPLTLSEAVSQAQRTSPVRSGAEALAAGMTDAWRLSGRPLNPALDVRTENWAPGTTPSAGGPLVDVFATMVQTIELGGKRSSRRSVAAADRDAAGASLRVVERQIALETVRIYVQGLRARGQLETLSANRDGFGALIDTARRRVEEGLAPESDLMKFTTEAARLDVDITRARIDLARSLATLTVLVGAPVPIAASQLVAPVSVAAPARDAVVVADAVGRLPEIVAARARVERARSVTALERARRTPDPAVTAGYKRTAGQNTTVFGVGIAVPLFERNGQAVARATAEERAAARELEALTLRATADAASLLDAAAALAARAARAEEDLLVPADGVRSAARATFREGAADMLRLIDAERVYADVRRAALDLELDAYLAAIEARFALGQEDIP